jgi:hypothetical protein
MVANSIRQALCTCLGGVLLAGVSAVVLAQEPAAMTAEKLRSMVVQPAGWTATYSHFSNRGDVGSVDMLFEVRGERVVATIKDVVHARSCERDVTITSDSVKFDGCAIKDITLHFDPNDPKYPFKGTSTMSYDFRLEKK